MSNTLFVGVLDIIFRYKISNTWTWAFQNLAKLIGFISCIKLNYNS